MLSRARTAAQRTDRLPEGDANRKGPLTHDGGRSAHRVEHGSVFREGDLDPANGNPNLLEDAARPSCSPSPGGLRIFVCSHREEYEPYSCAALLPAAVELECRPRRERVGVFNTFPSFRPLYMLIRVWRRRGWPSIVVTGLQVFS